MIRARRLVSGLALAGALLGATGCASSVDPIERLGRKAAGGLRDLGDPREAREVRERREAREVRERRDPREARERREVREAREARDRELEPVRNEPVRAAVLVPAAWRHIALNWHSA